MNVVFLYAAKPYWFDHTIAEVGPLEDGGPFGAIIRDEFYLAILREWLTNGHIEHAHVVAVTCREPNDRRYGPDGVWQPEEGITVYFVPNFDVLLRHYTWQPNDLLWVRGSSPWDGLVAARPWRTIIWYCANGDQPTPRYPVDAILIDNPARPVEGFHCLPFDKCADPHLFRPLDLPFEYDVIVAGSFNRRKNQVALAELLDPSLRVAFAGAFEDEDMVRQVRGLLPDATLTGFVDRVTLNRLYNQSRVAALYSRPHDATPRTIVESMAAGTPLVMADDMWYSTRYVHPESGLLAPRGPGFVEALCQAITRREMFNPRAAFEAHYTPDRVASALWERLAPVVALDTRVKVRERERIAWRLRWSRIIGRLREARGALGRARRALIGGQSSD
jgi:glycosyltransferase involved in cell wall biosynthesis